MQKQHLNLNVRVSKSTKFDFGFMLWIITEYLFSHTFISQLALFVFIGLFFLYIIQTRYILFSKIFIAYFAFFSICCLNILFGCSIQPDESKKLVFTLVLNFIFLVTAFNFVRKKSFKEILTLLIIASILISFLTWFLNIYQTKSFVFRQSGGVNSNGMSILNALVVGLICSTKRIKQRKYRLIAFLLLFFCVLSGTRKSLIFLAVYLVVFYCLKYPKRLPKYVLFTVLGIGIFYCLLMNIPFLYNNIGVRIESLLIFIQKGEGDSSIVSRASYIALGINYFKSSPILGNGINCFKTLPGAYGTYSHNNYVELLFSVGILGTVGFYLIYLFILLKAINNKRSSNCECSAMSIGIIISCALTDFAQVVYYDRGALLFIVLALSIIGISQEDE